LSICWCFLWWLAEFRTFSLILISSLNIALHLWSNDLVSFV
jgi:hypothetical protein